MEKNTDHSDDETKPNNKKHLWMWVFNTIFLPLVIASIISFAVINGDLTNKNEKISELKSEIFDYELRVMEEARLKRTVDGYEKSKRLFDREHYLEWFAEWADKVVKEVPASKERTTFLKDMERALEDNKVSDAEYKDIKSKYETLLKKNEVDVILTKIKPITSKG